MSYPQYPQKRKQAVFQACTLNFIYYSLSLNDIKMFVHKLV